MKASVRFIQRCKCHSYNGGGCGWRTGALYASDGTNQAAKLEDKEADFRRGEQNAIRIALEAMLKIAQGDK